MAPISPIATPAARACTSAQAASAGAGLTPGRIVTATLRPICRSHSAATRPSPPLFPGPHSTCTRRAWGATASASRATLSPARCISACAGNSTRLRNSSARVAALPCSQATPLAGVMRRIRRCAGVSTAPASSAQARQSQTLSLNRRRAADQQVGEHACRAARQSPAAGSMA